MKDYKFSFDENNLKLKQDLKQNSLKQFNCQVRA